MIKLNKKDNKKKSIIFLALFFILFFIIENKNHRFWLNDFKVYFFAAKSFFSGSHIYGKLFSLGSGYYKYSPFALIFFTPFILFSFSIAKIIYFFVYSSLVIYFLFYLYTLINKYIFNNYDETGVNTVILTSFFIVLVHIYRELHLGNLNFILLSIFFICINLLLNQKNTLAGIMLGLIILFKPFFIILFPLFLIRKKYKIIIVSLSSIIIGLFIPIIFIGVKNNFILLTNWYSTMVQHNVSASSDQTVHTLQTIFAPIYIKLFNSSPDKLYSLSIIAIISILFLIILIKNFKTEKLCSNETKKEHLKYMNIILESFILIAIIPNIVVTDTEHFLLSLPIIMTIINFYIVLHPLKNILFYFILISFIMYGGNWHDLWGKNISHWINQNGILGIGNFLLIINFIFIMFKLQKRCNNYIF